jgi:hypothetical protein
MVVVELGAQQVGYLGRQILAVVVAVRVALARAELVVRVS